jgi:predicted Zn-dependent protease
MTETCFIERLSRRLAGALLTVAVVAGSVGVVGCATNPASGADAFTPFMSEADEDRVGKEEHPKVLKEFGGAYNDQAVQKYVTSIGGLLKATTSQANKPYTFTVLDSDVVNAFALPGGYVYISRGLMALANDEAELAGVVGHEIGHVVARHTAQRYSQSVITGLGAAILGAITKSETIGNIAQLGAAAYVQGFSRDQELEADQLGIGYMTQAGFEPFAMSSFLSSLEGENQLALKKAGKEGADPEASLFSSHPRTADRVAIAARTAAADAKGPIARDREIYLKKIDGMIYGDSPSQGFVDGRRFMHPELKIGFEAPPGFRMQNGQDALIGRLKGGGAAFQFDGDRTKNTQRSMATYITSDWAPKLGLGDVETFTVNGMEAATGNAHIRSDSGQQEVRLVAIRFDANQIYRFMMVGAPEIAVGLEEQYREMVHGFRRISEREAATLKPRRLKVVTVTKGDTPESLARRMAVDEFPLDAFLVLNGLKPGAALPSGSKVKIVVKGS